MVVIGVVGKIGSGKDELAKTFNRLCDIPILSVGDIAREMADEQGVEKSRENLHNISLRAIKQNGDDFFIRETIEKVEESDWQSVCITGIRTPADVELLKGHFGEDFLLILVNVDDETLRYERLRKRNKPRDPESFSEFRTQELEEEQLFKLSETLEKADLTIDNNGTLYDFHQAIQKNLISNGLAETLNCNFNRDE